MVNKVADTVRSSNDYLLIKDDKSSSQEQEGVTDKKS